MKNRLVLIFKQSSRNDQLFILTSEVQTQMKSVNLLIHTEIKGIQISTADQIF